MKHNVSSMSVVSDLNDAIVRHVVSVYTLL